ncbi:hypothetical protein FDT66_01165 [Polaribacter aestuariivivens]|uniref:MotA/TolQ/ExbB proton channel domain-containing protein n=1 Tax=Polaribacter aestuariivivens TaxID=2304626 RepID=A0A5S3NC91_9FLAO|nr:MotA/TolQ/ExbB proton channel family protein [Polaribacter aestuariivivens]TMM32104.1 hypothetical protein FDT66_01165 [Polaribacter aestuariivivens]
MHLINEGGPFFMISLLILLALTFFLVVKGLKSNTQKNLELLKAISLFALVFGFFGFILGLIAALDALDSMNGDIATPVLAGGIKRGILPPTLGIFTFLVGRLGVIVITWLKKQ